MVTIARRLGAPGVEFTWLTIAVLIPLVFNPWGGNAFELPKTLLLRGLVLAMTLATLLQWLRAEGRADNAERQSSTHGLVLGFGLSFVLATLASRNPLLSLWGEYDRQQGLATLLAYLLLFFLTACRLRRRSQVDHLWRVLVWTSAPVVAYGLVQMAGWEPLPWRTDAVSPVLSTLGRANFLGAYLVLLIPLTMGRALVSRRRWTYGLLLGAQLCCLLATATRSAWIGVGVAAVVGGLTWAWAKGRMRWLLLAGAGVAILVLVMAVSLWLVEPAQLAALPGGERLAALFDTQNGSTAARLTIWRTAVPLLATRPWLGYGPETLSAVFAGHFPPELIFYQGRYLSVDRAHNLWLDLGLSAGLGAVLFFALILLTAATTIVRRLRQAPDRWTRLLWAALGAALAGHVAELQFSFETTATAVLFWLLLAMVVALGRGLANDESEPMPPATLHAAHGWLAAALPGVAIVALIAVLCVRPLLADIAYRQAQDAREPQLRLEAAARAVELWPFTPDYRLRLAWLQLWAGDPHAGETQIQAAVVLDPADPALWATQGTWYAAWAEREPGQWPSAAAAYRQALTLAPTIAAYHTALGLILVQQGALEEGVGELRARRRIGSHRRRRI